MNTDSSDSTDAIAPNDPAEVARKLTALSSTTVDSAPGSAEVVRELFIPNPTTDQLDPDDPRSPGVTDRGEFVAEGIGKATETEATV